MRSLLFGMLFWVVAGAISGSLYATGLGDLFWGDARQRSRAMEPITREEYQRRMRVYPQYGAALGLGAGLLFAVRRRSRRKHGSEPDAST